MPNKFRSGKVFKRKVKQVNPNGLLNFECHIMSCADWWATYKHFYPAVAHMTFQQAVDSGWLINHIKKVTEELKKRNEQ